jgi:cobalt/nickel transport system permease protein
MHMADALVAPAIAASMYTAASVTAGISVKKVRMEHDIRRIPVMGVMSAFVFAAQMINFTIPGTGSSGHFSGGLLLAVLLGPYAGFLSMVSILMIQCLIFADGGILALGCNIWNMAFYTCFIGYLCIYRPMTGKSLKPGRILAASVLSSIVSLQLGAFSVVLETMFSGISALSFGQFLAFMQPIHLLIGLVEGLITAAVISFIGNVRPELLKVQGGVNKVSLRSLLVIMAVITMLGAGGLSLAASEHPDGLEWSIQKITGASELEPEVSEVSNAAADIQEKTAVFPEYQVKDGFAKRDAVLPRIIGTIAVAFICFACGMLFRLFYKKDHTK